TAARSASGGRGDRSPGRGQVSRQSFSAGWRPHRTVVGRFPPTRERSIRSCPGFGLRPEDDVPMPQSTKRSEEGGGERGLPTLVDVALARAGAARPVAVQGRGEA